MSHHKEGQRVRRAEGRSLVNGKLFCDATDDGVTQARVLTTQNLV